MSELVLVAPLVEPIHLTEAKSHLRVTHVSEDALIGRWIAAARWHVETWCRRALVRQVRRLQLDAFPWVIELPAGPLRAVTAIQYLDPQGVSQTLDPAAYQVDALAERARIMPAYGESWPATRPALGAVSVTYACGMVAPITAVDAPSDTLTAPGHGLAADAPVTLSNSGGALPGALQARSYYVRAPAAETLQLAETAGGPAVDITETAGSGQSFLGALPADMTAAMLLLVEHFYRHRGEASEVMLHALPLGVERLLAPHRLVRF